MKTEEDIKRGNRIVAVREMLGFRSQEDFAVRIGFTQTAVSLWELGKRNPKEAFVEALQKLYFEITGNHLSRIWLLKGEGDMNTKALAPISSNTDPTYIEELHKEIARLRAQNFELVNKILGK